jgi:hypothetical protein
MKFKDPQLQVLHQNFIHPIFQDALKMLRMYIFFVTIAVLPDFALPVHFRLWSVIME